MKRESLVRFPVSQRVQMNFILSHNVDILYLSCIVKNLKTTALLSEKGRNKRRSNRLGLCPLLRLRLHCCRFLPSLNMKQVPDWLIEFWCLTLFQQYFSYIMAISFSGGRSRSTWREPPTMGKQLVNFITCGCESSAPFL
jgi:hypothetical protein